MEPVNQPQVVIIAGPNGAGKSTMAPELLQGTLAVDEFVNADVIASGLSAFNTEGVAIEAGRIMLTRLRHLAKARKSFAYETTLASRTFARWLRRLQDEGYQAHLLFLFLPSSDAAVARVAERVRLGGHSVPEEAIRRRYSRGLSNFFGLYRPLVNSWRLYDGSPRSGPSLVARGGAKNNNTVKNQNLWSSLLATYGHATE